MDEKEFAALCEQIEKAMIAEIPDKIEMGDLMQIIASILVRFITFESKSVDEFRDRTRQFCVYLTELASEYIAEGTIARIIEANNNKPDKMN